MAIFFCWNPALSFFLDIYIIQLLAIYSQIWCAYTVAMRSLVKKNSRKSLSIVALRHIARHSFHIQTATSLFVAPTAFLHWPPRKRKHSRPESFLCGFFSGPKPIQFSRCVFSTSGAAIFADCFVFPKKYLQWILFKINKLILILKMEAWIEAKTQAKCAPTSIFLKILFRWHCFLYAFFFQFAE